MLLAWTLVLITALSPHGLVEGCKRRRHHANFDDLKADYSGYAEIPKGYKHLNFNNFYLDHTSLEPASGKNYAGADPRLAYINTIEDGGSVNLMELDSFWFGCVANYGYDEPIPCTLTVTTVLDFRGGEYRNYDYTYKKKTPVMQRVDTGGIGGDYIYFTISKGTAYTRIFYDSFNYTLGHCTPPYG